MAEDLMNYIGAAAQFIPSIANSIGQGATNKTQKYLARLAYDKQLEMWNRTNEYNLPINQMERLKAAGLNPNLVYGTGTVTGNTTPASMPKYEPPNLRNPIQLDPMLLLTALNQYQDIKVKKAQENKINVDTNNAQLAFDIKKSIQDYIVQQEAEKTKQGLSQTEIMQWRENYSKIYGAILSTLNEAGYVNSAEMERFKSYGIRNEYLGANMDVAGQRIINYQQEAKNLELDNALKEFEKNFLSTGGKFYQPIIQFLRLLLGK